MFYLYIFYQSMRTEMIDAWSFKHYCSFSDCPAIRLPHQPGSPTCSSVASCTGIKCCVPVDIKVDILYVNVWLAIDPCNYTLSVGIGRWTLSATLTQTDFGTRRKVDLSRTMTFLWVYAIIFWRRKEALKGNVFHIKFLLRTFVPPLMKRKKSSWR